MKHIRTILLLLACVQASLAQPDPDTLWTRTYGGIGEELAYSVQQTADGGCVVSGYTESFGAGVSDFYLVKTDSQGDTVWTRTYGGGYADYGRSVQQTTDGGYVVAGYTYSFGAGSSDFYIVRTNTQGDTLWTRTYGGSSGDYACSVQQTADGGYVVAGYTRSFGAGSLDFYLVKTGPDISPAAPPNSPLPSGYELHANYPNPFNPLTTIRCDVGKTGPVSLKVFDLLGGEVATLAQGTIPAGSYTITWDATDLPSGLYLCRMNAGPFVQTRKMVLLK
jgi:hypothetical protein